MTTMFRFWNGTLTVSALGADTFDRTTLAVIGGGSVAAIAAVISLAEPEKRRQLQAEEVSGAGAVKKVYRGFDQEEGRDVAWNQVKLRSFGGDPSVLKRFFSEIKLLQTLENENIIVLYKACASGNLRDYRKKHRRVSLKALKNWSRQILRVKYEMRTLSQFRPLIPLLEAMPKELGASLHDMLNLITVKYIEHIEKKHMEPEEC
uniref:non-specific serine/threonine protein kinase n=1 Tax=Lactuca sativa TaxID=4236 RepID=A0A9R1ULM1_LACSA|nr:hypothetical protein LSAT_V11C800409500 [Lactuca sativa]